MDLFDTTDVLFSNIERLDPENARKIMCYILMQDLSDGDLMRLAFGPEGRLQSFVFKAKAHLGLSSSTLSTPLNPISRPSSSNSNNSQNPLLPSSPSLIPRDGFFEISKNIPSCSPVSSLKPSPFLSYENTRSGSLLVPHRTGDSNNDFIDENQMSDYFSFLNDSSTSKNDDFVGHRRSSSGSDACFGTAEEAGGFGGYRPCLYFDRGFCKNGDNCKFSHGAIVDSPSRMDLLYCQHEEMMRVRAAAHQQSLAGASSPLHCEKNMNILLQQQTDAQRAAALMFDEDIGKFAQGRAERNHFFAIVMGFAEEANSASKRIYLTFPPDSTFRDEDVSNYFSLFGPVHDVRIPYQKKRMYGFVEFVHPKTVRLILSRGNAHFICNSYVIVKPYKEKGKVPEKRQHLQQHFERGEFSPCSSPSGLDSRGPYDLHAGANMFYNTQKMMLRRELKEQTDLQQAIELQRRRFMNLQLPDFKNDGIHHHHRSLSVGASVPLPAYFHAGQSIDPPYSIKQEVSEVNGDNTAAVPSSMNAVEPGRSEINLCSKSRSWK